MRPAGLYASLVSSGATSLLHSFAAGVSAGGGATGKRAISAATGVIDDETVKSGSVWDELKLHLCTIDTQHFESRTTRQDDFLFDAALDPGICQSLSHI